MTIEGHIGVEEASGLLGLSVRHVRRLSDDGHITMSARGLVDLASVHQYLADRQGSTGGRAWSEQTAWAAVALLSDQDVDWLGGVQRSRLRGILRDLDSVGLARRTRNRAKVQRYTGHESAAARLRAEIVATDRSALGLVAIGGQAGADGYVATEDVDRLVAKYALRSDAAGGYVLRATGFDLDTVTRIGGAADTLVALDAAASLDPRERSQGHRILTERLDDFRG